MFGRIRQAAVFRARRVHRPVPASTGPVAKRLASLTSGRSDMPSTTIPTSQPSEPTASERDPSYVEAFARGLRVIRAFGELPNLCPALHLPLQAGSDTVLRRMGRKYDRARYLSIVADLRAARPDLALTTDLIVGFPGEGEDDFLQTLEMMELVRFESSFSFRYSDRPGVAAQRMEPKVPDAVGQERLLRLQSLQNGITKQTLKALEGRETDVLLEAMSRRQDEGETFWRGRDPGGRVVNVRMPGADIADPPLCGQMVPVRILEAKNHSLLAEPCQGKR